MSHSQRSTSIDRSRERESRHLWVGGLPDDIDEAGIKEYFTRYGKIEGVKILPQKYPNIGVAAFIDFYEVKSATEAKEAKHKLKGNELRTNFKANPSDKKPQDREKQDEKKSGSSSSGSESGSSSSSSSSGSDQEKSRVKKSKKKAGTSPSSLFIKVVGLANRPERVLLDGLYYEFCRYSTNVVVKMYGDAEKRWAMIKYKRADKCREAFTQSQGMVLFGSKIKLSLLDLHDFPPGSHEQGHAPFQGGGEMMSRQSILEDLDPLATRSLFVGNIPKQISVYELRDAFLRYGNVLDVEIKKMGGNATYGFILYYDLMSAVSAKQYMDGHNLKGNSIRVGFGKGTASKQLWIDGIDPNTSEAQLERHLGKYGKIMRLGIDRHRCCVMVQYDTMEAAKEALTSVKGTYIKNSRKLMTDFANRDARAAFFSRVESGDAGMPPRRGYSGPPGGMYGSVDMMDDHLMMMPRPGRMHMMGRGGGFPPHGHPMDFYYSPYMGDYYGGARPPFGPPGMHRYPPGPGGPYGREGADDYDEELRAFSRKREREKRIGGRRRETSSESGDSPDYEEKEGVELRKKKARKEKMKGAARKVKGEVSDEGETGSDSDEQHEEARLKATRKSRDHREKLKRRVRKKVKNEVSSEEGNSEEESLVIHKQAKNKSRPERKKSAEEDSSPTQPVKRKVQKASSSPDQPCPKSPPPKTPPTKQKRDKEKQEEAASSEEDSDLSRRNKPQKKEQQRKKEHQNKELKADVLVTSRSKVLQTEASNGAIAMSSVEIQKDRDKKDSGDEGRNSKERDKTATAPMPGKPKDKAGSPQSSVLTHSTKSSHSPRVNVESELSSGEDFKEGEINLPSQEKLSSSRPKQERNEVSDHEIDRLPLSSPGYSPRRPRTPNYPADESRWKDSASHIHPSSEKAALSEEEDMWSGRGEHTRKNHGRNLPRRYQIEPSSEQGPVPGRRDGTRYREGKDIRQERRYYGGQPLSPSPPPPSYAGHPRKRYHQHSPPPPDSFERRRHRGRLYSPAGGGHQHRRHSRSPPYTSPPPSHRAKSPYVSSPPHSRPRSPIPRVRGPRHRHESPFEGQRNKYPRARGSPPSPHHHFPYSPSPPPPRGGARSPPGRRFVRRRSSSLTPPRSGRGSRRDRSPGSDHIRGSPRPPPPDDRFESVKRHGGKRMVYSRTPSPKDKFKDMVKEEYPDLKRRKMDETRPKSPSDSPPPLTKSDKISRQQAHQLHSGQVSTDQQGLKQSNSSTMNSQQRPSSTSTDTGAKPTTPTQVPPKSSNPVPSQENNLMDLLRRYPVVWQGHLMLKNDSAAVQLHFLSGNVQLANSSLPQQSEQRTPILRISQRMRLEKNQLEGVDRRIQTDGEYCLLLALPCGRNETDVHTQTHVLKTNLINYLLLKQAAGIINVPGGQSGYVLHIFPPCPFSQSHLSRVAPDLLSSASDNCHLMIVVATM